MHALRTNRGQEREAAQSSGESDVEDPQSGSGLYIDVDDAEYFRREVGHEPEPGCAPPLHAPRLMRRPELGLSGHVPDSDSASRYEKKILQRSQKRQEKREKERESARDEAEAVADALPGKHKRKGDGLGKRKGSAPTHAAKKGKKHH